MDCAPPPKAAVVPLSQRNLTVLLREFEKSVIMSLKVFFSVDDRPFSDMWLIYEGYIDYYSKSTLL